MRSMVAHWLQMDMLHGNECVPVLIGAQGCGKTTFLRRMLPKELRQYYLDHLNLSNKFDKEMALTNNPHPLQDATGSRRFICLSIPYGKMIDNEGDIDYEQLYAQVLHELKGLKAPYWFNNEEVARIQQLNLSYITQKDLAQIVETCFRKPKEGEKFKSLSSTQMLRLIRTEFPSVQDGHSTKVQLGLALRELGFERHERCGIAYYKTVPLIAA
jgi:predicted P-loop ATPase